MASRCVKRTSAVERLTPRPRGPVCSGRVPHLRHTCALLLFAQGRNVKQVQGWLGHADPSFTLRTYVHLMDAGVGDADFLDEIVTAKPRPAIAAGKPKIGLQWRSGTLPPSRRGILWLRRPFHYFLAQPDACAERSEIGGGTK